MPLKDRKGKRQTEICQIKRKKKMEMTQNNNGERSYSYQVKWVSMWTIGTHIWEKVVASYICRSERQVERQASILWRLWYIPIKITSSHKEDIYKSIKSGRKDFCGYYRSDNNKKEIIRGGGGGRHKHLIKFVHNLLCPDIMGTFSGSKIYSNDSK